MDYLAPSMYDVSNIDMWKFKMSSYLKAIGLHVYLSKKNLFDNDKFIEANAQTLMALKHTLSKDHLYMVSHYDSVFAVWNILTSPKQQMTNNVEGETIVDESDQACFMV